MHTLLILYLFNLTQYNLGNSQFGVGGDFTNDLFKQISYRLNLVLVSFHNPQLWDITVRKYIWSAIWADTDCKILISIVTSTSNSNEPHDSFNYYYFSSFPHVVTRRQILGLGNVKDHKICFFYAIIGNRRHGEQASC